MEDPNQTSQDVFNPDDFIITNGAVDESDAPPSTDALTFPPESAESAENNILPETTIAEDEVKIEQPESDTKIPAELYREPTGSESAVSDASSLKRARPHDEENGQGWETVDRKSKKAKKQKKIPQTTSPNYPSITFNFNAKLQSKISLDQFRNLVLYIFAEGVSPQWVAIANRTQFRKIVAIMVPGLDEAMFKQDVDFSTYNEQFTDLDHRSRVLTSPDDYYPRLLKKEELPVALNEFADMFPHLWPVKTPGNERYGVMRSPLGTILTAAAEKTKEEKSSRGVQHAKEPKGWKDQRTRITEFLSMPEDFLSNGYIVHPACISEERRQNYIYPEGWVHTLVNTWEEGNIPEEQIEQGSVTAGRDVYSLDCEMCITGKDEAGQDEYSLTRISLLAWDGTVVVDELVKPDKEITDYLTRFSGITEALLAPVTTRLCDIQIKLVRILTPHSILIGHSLESDLKALRLTHPFVVDTSLIFPHQRGPPLKNGLKFLTQKFLKREIQNHAGGHDSVEDARACLDLVRQKCEKGKSWGMHESQGENLFRRLSRAGVSYRANGGVEALGGARIGKTSAMIDWGDPMKGPGAAATHTIGCNSDEEVMHGVLRAVQGDPVAEVIPSGGVDFVFARFRELEALQGWWNNNRSTEGLRPPDMSGVPLETCVQNLTRRIKTIYDGLPKCTGFIVFNGSGDPREMSRLQAMQAQFKKEYHTPGSVWDELSVKWTSNEDTALKQSVTIARSGIGFIGVK